MRLVIGNEPRCYREAIAAALRELRPEVEVHDVEAADLDAEVLRLQPEMVICSALTWSVATTPLSWVVLYPDGGSRTELCVAGERTTLENAEFSHLLAAVDETASVAARAPTTLRERSGSGVCQTG